MMATIVVGLLATMTVHNIIAVKLGPDKDHPIVHCAQYPDFLMNIII